MNKLSFVLLTLTIIYISNIKYVELCVPKVYFPEGGAKAIAVMKGSLNGSPISGTIRFEQADINEPVIVRVNISGLQTGQGETRHGLHVHLNGISDISDNTTSICGSSGPHFNPLNKTHGDIRATERHVGDYGNVISNNEGRIITTFNDSVSNLYGPLGIIGRTIVLHQLEDDLGLKGDTGSKSTGNSGSRLACGVIGITV